MNHFPKDSGTRRAFADVTISNLITKDASADLSLAVANVEGDHPPSRSSRCLRAYYILEGNAEIRIGDASHKVAAGDALLIPVGQEHSVSGHVRYLVINTPAFDPDLE